MKLGDVVPSFNAQSTAGDLDWHQWLGGAWGMLCSHPSDFTPVCTTELATLARLQHEFDKRGVKVAAVSCNDNDSHKGWIADIESTKWAGGAKVKFPLIADPKRSISYTYDMMDPDEMDSKGLPMTCRAVFIIGPDKTLKASILYPATTGRNFHEILRVIDSLQLTAKHKVATPVDWCQGDKCMITPVVTDEEAKEKFNFQRIPVPSGKGYIRLTADPSGKMGGLKHLNRLLTSLGLVAVGALAQKKGLLPAAA